MILEELTLFDQPKQSRVVDKDLLKTYHSMKCVACGATPCDPCHIKSRGAGGPDEEWNLWPGCRRCHSIQHQIGILTFAVSRPQLWDYITSRGWGIVAGKLTHRGRG